MKKIKHFGSFAHRYVEWVVRLGKIRFSLLGVMILAILALCTQMVWEKFTGRICSVRSYSE